jgi:hypothetical protein
MKSIRMLAAAAALMSAATMIDGAGAAEPAQPGPSGAWMMGNWMTEPNGTMNYGGPGMMGYYGMGPAMMGWGGSGEAMCNAMAGHIEGRLAYLKAELKITETQEALWNAYAAAARDNMKSMLAHCTTMMSSRSASALRLPERLDQHEQLMTAQLEALRAMNNALKPLYAAFSEDQKQAADRMFWGPMNMM